MRGWIHNLFLHRMVSQKKRWKYCLGCHMEDTKVWVETPPFWGGVWRIYNSAHGRHDAQKRKDDTHTQNVMWSECSDAFALTWNISESFIVRPSWYKTAWIVVVSSQKHIVWGHHWSKVNWWNYSWEITFWHVAFRITSSLLILLVYGCGTPKILSEHFAWKIKKNKNTQTMEYFRRPFMQITISISVIVSRLGWCGPTPTFIVQNPKWQPPTAWSHQNLISSKWLCAGRKL